MVVMQQGGESGCGLQTAREAVTAAARWRREAGPAAAVAEGSRRQARRDYTSLVLQIEPSPEAFSQRDFGL